MAEQTQSSIDLLKQLGEGAGEYKFQTHLLKISSHVLGWVVPISPLPDLKVFCIRFNRLCLGGGAGVGKGRGSSAPRQPGGGGAAGAHKFDLYPALPHSVSGPIPPTSAPSNMATAEEMAELAPTTTDYKSLCFPGSSFLLCCFSLLLWLQCYKHTATHTQQHGTMHK